MSAEWTPLDTVEEVFARIARDQTPGINPVSGARTEEALPKGNAPLQLYSLATPNGQKVGILLEELGVDYDAHVVNIMANAQFTSGFTSGNPNGKIPMIIDYSLADGPLSTFESANIMLYLAEKHDRFIFKDVKRKTEMMAWIFWQMVFPSHNRNFNLTVTFIVWTRSHDWKLWSLLCLRSFLLLAGGS